MNVTLEINRYLHCVCQYETCTKFKDICEYNFLCVSMTLVSEFSKIPVFTIE